VLLRFGQKAKLYYCVDLVSVCVYVCLASEEEEKSNDKKRKQSLRDFLRLRRRIRFAAKSVIEL